MPPSTIAASPRARRAMRAGGINPSTLKGSGPNGRIVFRDVARAPAGAGSAQAEAASAMPPGTSQRRPMSGLRRTIARRLVQSKQTVPHFYLRQTVDAGALAAFYAARKAEFPVSLNDLVVKAVALAVREFPAFRTQIDGDDLVEFADANIGLAVGLDEGVIVAQVGNADRLPLRELAAESRRVVALARERKNAGSAPSVFTVSNLGMFGIDEFSAIVNPPESAILAVGALRDHAFVRKGGLFAGKAMTVTLSCDHRIVDGLGAARFVARLREMLEAPDKHLLHS